MFKKEDMKRMQEKILVFLLKSSKHFSHCFKFLQRSIRNFHWYKNKNVEKSHIRCFFCFECNSIYFNLYFEKLRVNFVQNQSKIFEICTCIQRLHYYLPPICLTLTKLKQFSVDRLLSSTWSLIFLFTFCNERYCGDASSPLNDEEVN